MNQTDDAERGGGAGQLIHLDEHGDDGDLRADLRQQLRPPDPAVIAGNLERGDVDGDRAQGAARAPGRLRNRLFAVHPDTIRSRKEVGRVLSL